jgi:hypothetical protein
MNENAFINLIHLIMDIITAMIETQNIMVE